MNKNTKENNDYNLIQKSMYNFPYHYIVDFDYNNHKNFTQSLNYVNGYQYAGYLYEILTLLKSLSFKSLIDVGCGDGFFLRKVYQSFPDKNILGVDIEENALNFAKIFNGNINYIKKDIIKDKIKEKFEIVTLIEVLEHIPLDMIKDFLSGLHKLLTNEGKLIITVPSKNLSIKNIKRHIQHFDKDSITYTLSDYFKIEHIEYLNKKNIFTKIIHKIFSNSFFILNHKKIIDYLFSKYLKFGLKANDKNGLRILCICKKK